MSLISPAALFLDEVARSGSIRKAAERLNVSPSALNRRILNLEAEYGLQLFDRLPRGVRLTAAGEVLLADIRRWRNDLEKSKIRLQELQGLRRGHVAVGLMECLSNEFATSLLERIQTQFKQFTLDMFIGGTSQVLEKIQANELDVAVCFNVADRANINKLLTIDIPAGIVVGASHPLAGKESVSLGESLEFPFILPDTSLAARKLIDRAMQAVSYQAIPSLVTNSTSLMKKLVGDGRHIAFLSAIDVNEELKDGSVSFIRVSGWHVPLEDLSLVARNSHHLSSAARAVVNILKEQMEALPFPRNKG